MDIFYYLKIPQTTNYHDVCNFYRYFTLKNHPDKHNLDFFQRVSFQREIAFFFTYFVYLFAIAYYKAVLPSDFYVIIFMKKNYF